MPANLLKDPDSTPSSTPCDRSSERGLAFLPASASCPMQPYHVTPQGSLQKDGWRTIMAVNTGIAGCMHVATTTPDMSMPKI